MIASIGATSLLKHFHTPHNHITGTAILFAILFGLSRGTPLTSHTEIPTLKGKQRYVRAETLAELFPENIQLDLIKNKRENIVCLIQRHQVEGTKSVLLEDSVIPSVAMLKCTDEQKTSRLMPQYNNLVIDFQTNTMSNDKEFLTAVVAYSIIVTIAWLLILTFWTMPGNKKGSIKNPDFQRRNTGIIGQETLGKSHDKLMWGLAPSQLAGRTDRCKNGKDTTSNMTLL